MQPDYNIEFAHMYADESFGDEQIKSIEILKKITSRLKKENKTFVISFLIDEFHPTVFKLNENKIIKEFEKQGISIDFIGYESKLGLVADEIIKELPTSMLKIENFNKMEKDVLLLKNHNGKIGLKEDFKFMYRHTCALLSASWSLCRLGILKIPPDAVCNLTGKIFESKKIITILPEKYHLVEDKVIEIVESTRFKDSIEDMNYKFFEI